VNSDRLGNWLQTGANLGILAGLIMVWLQMNQNEQLLRLQITTGFYESYISADTAIAGEDMPSILQKSIMEPDQLTYGEMRAMDAQTFSPLNRWISLYRLSEAGLLDDSLWRSQVDLDAPYYFGTPYGRAWWEVSRVVISGDTIPVPLRDYIDERLAEAPLNGFTNYYDRIQARALELEAQLRETEGLSK